MNFAPDDFLSPAVVRSRDDCEVAFAQLTLIKVAVLARGDAGLQFASGIEEGAAELKRIDDLALRQMIERHASQPLQQKTKHDETEVAVNDSLSSLVFQRLVRDGRERALLLMSRKVKRTPGRQSGSVRQQLAHGDVMFVSSIEFLKVLRHGAVERQLSRFDQTRAKQSGYERLCQRREIVNRLE